MKAGCMNGFNVKQKLCPSQSNTITRRIGNSIRGIALTDQKLVQAYGLRESLSMRKLESENPSVFLNATD